MCPAQRDEDRIQEIKPAPDAYEDAAKDEGVFLLVPRQNYRGQFNCVYTVQKKTSNEYKLVRLRWREPPTFVDAAAKRPSRRSQSRRGTQAGGATQPW